MIKESICFYQLNGATIVRFIADILAFLASILCLKSMPTTLEYQESIYFLFWLLACLKLSIGQKSIFLMLRHKIIILLLKFKLLSPINTHYWLFLLYFSQLEPFLFCLDHPAKNKFTSLSLLLLQNPLIPKCI